MEAVEYEAMYAQEAHFWWYRALHDILLARLENLALAPGFRLLDAGCGTGGLLKKMSVHFPEAELHGLEYHHGGVEHLKRLSNVSIVNGNINGMPYADNSFHVITLIDVLYHREVDPACCLAECYRILKPGGQLLVNVAAYQWMLSAHDRQVHTRERYTVHKLRQQLTRQGFTARHVGYWNSLLFPLMMIHRLTAGQHKASSDVQTLPDWQNNAFYRMIRCEQFLQQHHIHLPFGGSVWARASKT